MTRVRITKERLLLEKKRGRVLRPKKKEQNS
jgi:hypothetical protein